MEETINKGKKRKTKMIKNDWKQSVRKEIRKTDKISFH